MSVAPAWPTRPDGSNKKWGELTRQERAAQIVSACAKLQAELESPAMRRALAVASRRLQEAVAREGR